MFRNTTPVIVSQFDIWSSTPASDFAKNINFCLNNIGLPNAWLDYLEIPVQKSQGDCIILLNFFSKIFDLLFPASPRTYSFIDYKKSAAIIVSGLEQVNNVIRQLSSESTGTTQHSNTLSELRACYQKTLVTLRTLCLQYRQVPGDSNELLNLMLSLPFNTRESLPCLYSLLDCFYNRDVNGERKTLTTRFITKFLTNLYYEYGVGNEMAEFFLFISQKKYLNVLEGQLELPFIDTVYSNSINDEQERVIFSIIIYCETLLNANLLALDTFCHLVDKYINSKNLVTRLLMLVRHLQHWPKTENFTNFLLHPPLYNQLHDLFIVAANNNVTLNLWWELSQLNTIAPFFLEIRSYISEHILTSLNQKKFSLNVINERNSALLGLVTISFNFEKFYDEFKIVLEAKTNVENLINKLDNVLEIYCISHLDSLLNVISDNFSTIFESYSDALESRDSTLIQHYTEVWSLLIQLCAHYKHISGMNTCDIWLIDNSNTKNTYYNFISQFKKYIINSQGLNNNNLDIYYPLLNFPELLASDLPELTRRWIGDPLEKGAQSQQKKVKTQWFLPLLTQLHSYIDVRFHFFLECLVELEAHLSSLEGITQYNQLKATRLIDEDETGLIRVLSAMQQLVAQDQDSDIIKVQSELLEFYCKKFLVNSSRQTSKLLVCNSFCKDVQFFWSIIEGLSRLGSDLLFLAGITESQARLLFILMSNEKFNYFIQISSSLTISNWLNVLIKYNYNLSSIPTSIFNLMLAKLTTRQLSDIGKASKNIIPKISITSLEIKSEWSNALASILTSKTPNKAIKCCKIIDHISSSSLPLTPYEHYVAAGWVGNLTIDLLSDSTPDLTTLMPISAYLIRFRNYESNLSSEVPLPFSDEDLNFLRLKAYNIINKFIKSISHSAGLGNNSLDILEGLMPWFITPESDCKDLTKFIRGWTFFKSSPDSITYKILRPTIIPWINYFLTKYAPDCLVPLLKAIFELNELGAIDRNTLLFILKEIKANTLLEVTDSHLIALILMHTGNKLMFDNELNSFLRHWTYAICKDNPARKLQDIFSLLKTTHLTPQFKFFFNRVEKWVIQNNEKDNDTYNLWLTLVTFRQQLLAAKFLFGYNMLLRLFQYPNIKSLGLNLKLLIKLIGPLAPEQKSSLLDNLPTELAPLRLALIPSNCGLLPTQPMHAIDLVQQKTAISTAEKEDHPSSPSLCDTTMDTTLPVPEPSPLSSAVLAQHSRLTPNSKIVYFSKKYFGEQSSLPNLFLLNQNPTETDYTRKHMFQTLQTTLARTCSSNRTLNLLHEITDSHGTYLNFYSPNGDPNPIHVVTFIFAGRKHNALLPDIALLGTNQYCITVVTREEFNELNLQHCPENLGFLVIDSLGTAEQGMVTHTGSIQSRRDAAFRASWFFKLTECVYLDDNIRFIGDNLLTDAPLSWSDVTEKLKQTRLTTNTLIAGLRTISNRSARGKSPYCYKLFSLNFEEIIQILALDSSDKISMLSFPPIYNQVCMEDYFFQILIDFANFTQAGSKELVSVMDVRLAGLKRAIKLANVAKQNTLTFEAITLMDIEKFYTSTMTPLQKQWLSQTLLHLKKAVEFNRAYYDKQYNQAITRTDLQKIHLLNSHFTGKKRGREASNSTEKKDSPVFKKQKPNWEPKGSSSTLVNCTDWEGLAGYLADPIIFKNSYPFQREAIEAISSADKIHGLLKISTGCGKTRLQILLINYLLSTPNQKPIFIITANLKLVNQFYDDFRDLIELLGEKANLKLEEVLKVSSDPKNVPWQLYHGNTALRNQIKVAIFCSNSYQISQEKGALSSNHELVSPSIFFLDECHLYPNLHTKIRTVTSLAFSATPVPVIEPLFTFSRLQSVKAGITAPMILDRLPFELNKHDKDRWQRVANLLAHHCHPEGKSLINYKGIIFVDSISEAIELTTYINSLPIIAELKLSRPLVVDMHSKNPATHQIIEEFNQLPINEPAIGVAVRMLRVGYNDQGLSYVLIAGTNPISSNKTLQSEHKIRTIEQMLGRVLRINPNHPNKIAYVLADKTLNLQEFEPARDIEAIKKAHPNYAVANHQLLYLEALNAINKNESFAGYQYMFDYRLLEKCSLSKHLELLLNAIALNKSDWITGLFQHDRLLSMKYENKTILEWFANNIYSSLKNNNFTPYHGLYSPSMFEALLKHVIDHFGCEFVAKSLEKTESHSLTVITNAIYQNFKKYSYKVISEKYKSLYSNESQEQIGYKR